MQEQRGLQEVLQGLQAKHKLLKMNWDYQKDKEAKRVFERKKELQKLREKERKSKDVMSVGTLNIPGHVLVNYVERRGMSLKTVPS